MHTAHFIVYLSESTPSLEGIEADLRSIRESSQRNNPLHGIYGALFYHQGQFLQAIEGKRETLEILMAVLEKDRRHRNIVRIIDEPVAARSFDGWNMDTFSLSPCEKLDQDLLERFKSTFLGQAPLEGRVFIDLLKKFCATPSLRHALVTA